MSLSFILKISNAKTSTGHVTAPHHHPKTIPETRLIENSPSRNIYRSRSCCACASCKYHTAIATISFSLHSRASYRTRTGWRTLMDALVWTHQHTAQFIGICMTRSEWVDCCAAGVMCSMYVRSLLLRAPMIAERTTDGTVCYTHSPQVASRIQLAQSEPKPVSSSPNVV